MAQTVAATPQVQGNVWYGGFSPFRVSWGKLMMWYFLVGDSFSFGAFLLTYGALRFSYDSWPKPTEVFASFPFLEGVYVPLGFVSFMTFTLIMSSVTMVLAVHYGNVERDRKKVAKWLAWTIVGGLVFLLSQAWEWTHLIHQGMNMKENPFGAPAFGWLFFTITGFHGFHVFTGVIINVIVINNVLRGVYDRRGSYEMVEKVGLYWHFVDLVWVFVFMAFYLL